MAAKKVSDKHLLAGLISWCFIILEM